MGILDVEDFDPGVDDRGDGPGGITTFAGRTLMIAPVEGFDPREAARTLDALIADGRPRAEARRWFLDRAAEDASRRGGGDWRAETYLALHARLFEAIAYPEGSSTGWETAED